MGTGTTAAIACFHEAQNNTSRTKSPNDYNLYTGLKALSQALQEAIGQIDDLR